jgi:hypothetical protein
MSAEPSVSARPAARPLILVAVVFLAALGAATLIPRVDLALNPGSSTPGVISFLGVGLAVLALTGVLFMAGLRKVLPKGVVFIASALGYNALLVTVKFTLGPVALYIESERSGMLVLTNPLAFPGLAAITALLYAVGFLILYAIYNSGMQRRLGVPVSLQRGVIQLFTAMFFIAVAGVATVVGVGGFLEYALSVFFGSVIGLLVAVALVGAIVLASRAFSDAASQAVMTRNVAVMSTFAWVGLAFIAAYHILWFVFLLTLISLWPLRAYSAK